jgi:16S rRNA (guanine(966)-N(2))-methyltransferase RsmD
MRVIAGALKGRRLRSPRWEGLRPTSDRLRETLFNVLGDGVRNARVLDGCAGTGAIGIEALSRGARQVVFVERGRRATVLISENVAICGLTDRSVIVRGPLPGVLGRSDAAGPFDLVLLDPPYEHPRIGAILSAASECLAADGWLVLERTRRSTTLAVAGLEHVRSVTSGDSVLDIYERAEKPPAAMPPDQGR